MSNVPTPDETPAERYVFADLLDAYRIGRKVGEHANTDSGLLASLARIEARLQAAERDEHRAFASGFVEGASARHSWDLTRDLKNKRFVWRCTCNHIVYQPFGDAVPGKLISHPAERG